MADKADVTEAVKLCRSVLGSRPSGLLTDIDGTISLIAPTPDAASVSDEARSALHRLAEQLDVVGVVTGRSAGDAEAMVGVPTMLHIGNHGMEQRRAGVTTVNLSAAAMSKKVLGALEAIESSAFSLGFAEGIIYENKGLTGSIHYRLAPDQDTAHALLLQLANSEASDRNLRVTEGRMVVELRPPIPINKGTAVENLVSDSGLKGLVFLGDDVTDVDAFHAVTRLRNEGSFSGTTVAVVAPETNPEVLKSADIAIHGVESCIRLLSELADSLCETQSSSVEV
jgi:trehalose 6-phosphate phosphatase